MCLRELWSSVVFISGIKNNSFIILYTLFFWEDLFFCFKACVEQEEAGADRCWASSMGKDTSYVASPL